MFNKLFRKDEPQAKSATTPEKPAQAAPRPAPDRAPWVAQLAAAAGNDSALLELAAKAPFVDLKLQAIQALSGQEALKQAERDFRNRDRRVHREAKQRLEEIGQRRDAHDRADALIAGAESLAQESLIPANRLVEIDHAWKALDARFLDDALRARFDAAWTRLSGLTRERGEQQLAQKRWLVEANRVLLEASTASAALAEADGDAAGRARLSTVQEQIRQVLASRPAAPATDSIAAALGEAGQAARAVEARVALLGQLQSEPPARSKPAAPRAPGAADALQPAALPPNEAAEEPGIADPSVETGPAAAAAAPIESLPATAAEMPEATHETTAEAKPQAPVPAPADAPDPAPTAPAAPALSPAARWQALEPIPASHARLADLLDARFARWQASLSSAREARAAESKQRARDAKRAVSAGQQDALAAHVTAGEAALAEGHPADAQKHLAAIEEALKGLRPEGALAARIEAFRAGYARLKGWQQWGGGRARDDLADEAEALAKAAAGGKVAIKAHGDSIERLRARWKELDKLGGATSRPLWQRFDTALKAAYEPIAAHLERQKAVRDENLAARKALLAVLDAVPLGGAAAATPTPPSPGAADTASTEPPGAVPAATVAEPSAGVPPDAALATAPAQPATTPAPGAAPDWRAIARALEHFQSEWRKLGPLEHTVPHKARDGLTARWRASVARLEGPLDEARRVEQLAREKLVEQAKAVAASPTERDAIPRVRDLQAAWQARAKAMPLARHAENALWTAFKAATDSVFKQRDAAHAERDAGFKAARQAREALVARLQEIGESMPEAEIRRAVSAIDAEWRKAAEPARADAAALEARYRAAKQAAQGLLAGSAQRSWAATIDAVAAKRLICREREAGASADADDLAARWTGAGQVPPAWEAALAARRDAVAPPAAVDLDATLLELEAALELPSPPQYQAARRELKLRAMKNALEARQMSAVTPTDIEQMIARALAHPAPSAEAEGRLTALLAALKTRPPR